MIWSLIKVLLFVAAIAALTMGAGHLMDMGGGLRLTIGGWEFSLGPLQAVIAALLLVLALWIVMKLVGFLVAVLRFLNGDETAVSRYFDRNRERKGYEALSDGLMALASGEGRLAMIKAQRAEKLLGRPELTNLVTAQAAEMVGDSKRAEEVYKRLLSDDRSRFVGIRGIMKQKLAAGDTETAKALAEKAFALKPRHAETQDILLELQAKQGDWTGARATLTAKARSGYLPRDVHRRRDAVLALQEAKDILDSGKSIEAREAAIAANRKSPDLVPAAAMAARGYIADGKPKYASRVLRKAWEMAPHPDLAAAFAEIAPDESPEDRLKRFKALTSQHPEHAETRMLLAELNIAAEDFPAARRALGDLVETNPTARVLTIMAAIERGEGSDDAVVRGWLTRALTAPRGPHWVCDKCQAVHAQWGPVCGNCGGFDTLTWREPPESTGPSATQTEMLPLIVGAPGTSAASGGAPADAPAKAEVEDAELVPEAPPADSPRAGAN
ncbi:heme biosynthesis protein HemY [Defluviimonas sp. 20V17]|uniref:HemY protein n=1 Tax=Allgaiera indica TaxID=765699 RepID=A0AAN4UMN5_9RHOB|nr:heme biosynthesis HemY N-terminal domain-containing protein [Allgaiera indica]KDB03594.1 heme biosynthesis protein HemY [Defluviimonas sp. 20V17]GHD98322.1 heme biosynthesis protein HemY [Allgaiera indica]SDW49519.1 HemY protein [Allgaiera indica]